MDWHAFIFLHSFFPFRWEIRLHRRVFDLHQMADVLRRLHAWKAKYNFKICIFRYSSRLEALADSFVLGMQAQMIQKIQGLHYPFRMPYLDGRSHLAMTPISKTVRSQIACCHKFPATPPMAIAESQINCILSSCFVPMILQNYETY